MRAPDFDNLLAVIRRETPTRPTLFEFFLNATLYQHYAGNAWTTDPDLSAQNRMLIAAFQTAGYDYATVRGSTLTFPDAGRAHASTISLNEGSVIHDRASFESYPWPDPSQLSYQSLDDVAPDLPDGMKLIVCGPGGVLENVITLVGYDNLCYMLVDDPPLVADIFQAVGTTLIAHYAHAAPHPTVGACISNDDWGFKTQTMIKPEHMRQYVFPWHQRIVQTIHAAGKPAILHSCGNLKTVMDDIIDDLHYDAKHSYEDVIQPVEDAYDTYADRIAILGGIDLDYVCRSTPAQITVRTQAMLDKTNCKAWAIGTGNSVPDYVPHDNYRALTQVIHQS